ncbi:MAG: phosphoribosylamine--glycine ligase [Nannocystaceae bacterium]|nr:phosphoribosylamine--glycine ligase [bacterium]
MAKFLIIGGGGREHAIGWRLHAEGHEVHAAPGNPGLAELGTNHPHPVGDPAALVELAKTLEVDLVVIGPEQPLVDGLADVMREAGVAVFGPSAAAARLEASKAESKTFMAAHGIPTARHVTVTSLDEGLAAVRTFEVPPVVKADGLAAGKGVTVAQTHEEAEDALRACLQGGAFGEAGATVVLEQRLTGQEVSFFVISDGTHAATLLPAQDHKRIGEGDTGPNTGGMGAYAPAPIFTDAVRAKTMARIVAPTLAGLRAQGRPFVGVLFVGLMIDDAGDPWVVEYNVRFGDPETQPLMLGLQAPLGETLLAAVDGTLTDQALPGTPAATVVMASAGYPASSHKGDRIEGLEAAGKTPGVTVFHAGTRGSAQGELETAGGRVLGVCASADALDEALRRAYAAIDQIRFDGMQFRRDIGRRASLV